MVEKDYTIPKTVPTDMGECMSCGQEDGWYCFIDAHKVVKYW